MTAAETTTAPPNQNTTIGTVNNTSADIVKSTFPFPVQKNGRKLIITPSNQITPGTYNGEVTFSTGNTTAYTVKIPKVSNWTLNTDSLNNTISVGENSEIRNLTVTLEGNTPTRLTANITGNLSQFYDTQPFFEIYPGLSKTITVGFQVPSDTPFGRYTGKLVLEDSTGQNKTVDLSGQFNDEIKPEIQDANFPDTMATRPSSQNLVIEENLQLDTVQTEIVRTIEVQQGNETVEMNETVGTYQFEKKENTDLWTHEFTDTQAIASYYAHITVNDTSGNTVNRTTQFDVNGLDALEVVNGDFQFGKIKDQSEARKLVLENTVESPFNLSLDTFSYSGNSSVKVGVVPPDATQPRFFEDKKLQFKKEGEYRLVVKFYDEEPYQDLYEYDGTVGIELPDQHHPVNNIHFGGTVDSFGYPEPSTIYEGGADFEGFIGYGFESVKESFEDRFGSLENQNSSYAYKISRINVDACTGDDEWGDCSDLTMGEYQDTIQENNQLSTERNFAIGLALVAIISTGIYIRKENLDTQLAMPTFKK